MTPWSLYPGKNLGAYCIGGGWAAEVFLMFLNREKSLAPTRITDVNFAITRLLNFRF
jgi:hypothetical protein